MHKHVVHVIPSLGIGGAETMLVELVRGLVAPFFKHTIITLQSGGRLVDTAKEAGAAVIELGMPPGIPNLGGMTKLLTEVVKEPADIVHGWRYHGNVVAQTMRAVMQPQPFAVWSIHALTPDAEGQELADPRVAGLNVKLSAKADAIAYFAHASMQSHASLGFSETHAVRVPSGVDTNVFAPKADAAHRLRVRLGLAPETPLVGLVEPLRIPKDPTTFFVGVEFMAETNVHFVLVGEEFDTIPQPFATQLSPNLRGRVHCLGVQRDMAMVLAGLDVCTRSARTEALPRTLLEAMACQTLCVATDVGDVKALLQDVGWVAPAGDGAALAAGWKAALGCELGEAQRRLESGRKRVTDKYSASSMASAISGLYAQLGQA